MQGLQSGRSPLEVDWRWRRVVSCCYGWLPAWLWGWWWWWLGYGHLDVCMLSMVTVLLQEIEILCGFLLPLICEWGSMDVCAWGEPLARLSMSILHTRSTPSRPHTDWYKLCCAYSCNFVVENIIHNTTAQPHSYLQKQCSDTHVSILHFKYCAFCISSGWLSILLLKHASNIP